MITVKDLDLVKAFPDRLELVIPQTLKDQGAAEFALNRQLDGSWKINVFRPFSRIWKEGSWVEWIGTGSAAKSSRLLERRIKPGFETQQFIGGLISCVAPQKATPKDSQP